MSSFGRTAPALAATAAAAQAPPRSRARIEARSASRLRSAGIGGLNLTRRKTRAFHPRFMKLADFDFHLPDERIALRPVVPRDSARLLVVAPGAPLEDLRVRDLPGLLRAGDVLVLNDTRVIPARLKGVRHREATAMAVQATLHKRLSPSVWTAFMRPGKRLAVGDRVSFGETNDRACLLGCPGRHGEGQGRGRRGDAQLLDLMGPDLDAAIAERGAMPLPPYIAAKRAEDERDRADYQDGIRR